MGDSARNDMAMSVSVPSPTMSEIFHKAVVDQIRRSLQPNVGGSAATVSAGAPATTTTHTTIQSSSSPTSSVIDAIHAGMADLTVQDVLSGAAQMSSVGGGDNQPDPAVVQEDDRANTPDRTSTWRRLAVSIDTVNLDLIMQCGQTFRWFREENDSGPPSWIGVIGDKLYELIQYENEIRYQVERAPDCLPIGEVESDRALASYLTIDIGPGIVEDLYNKWSQQHAEFARLVSTAPSACRGLRIIREPDLITALFGFLGATSDTRGTLRLQAIQHNTVYALSTLGWPIGERRGRMHYQFPKVATLMRLGQDQRVSATLGKRASAIVLAAKKISEYD